MDHPDSVIYIFPYEIYCELCEFAKLGSLPPLKRLLDFVSMEEKAKFGIETFCPPPKQHLPSPLVLAAQYGHINIISYLLTDYSEFIDINQGATIVSRTTKKKVHHATALWAACTGGHIEIVKYLVKFGADVNKTTLTRSTPLRGASFHGFLPVMEYLLQKGADINTPNCIGQSPLCIAAMRGELEAVKFLLSHGADINQCTINGYSVMHLAAAKGKNEVLTVLLEHNISPGFNEACPYDTAYIPCPLFLAASTGQTKAVEILIHHPECPVACKMDAYLLMAAMQCELRKKLRITEPKIQELWVKGLAIREEHGISIYEIPVEEYGHRKEIMTKEELVDVWHTEEFALKNVFYQSLLIRERCMGSFDQGLIYFLIRRGSYFCHDACYKEAELLWRRAMKLEVKVCEAEINHPRYGHCEGIMRDLEKDLTIYTDGIRAMIEGGYKPDFALYVEYGMQELSILGQLGNKADSEVVSVTIILGLILEVFLSWLLYDKCSMGYTNGSWSKECNSLGEKFVQQYLHYKSGTTLLHLALTNFSVSDSEERHVLDHFNNLKPIVTALLAWGAGSAIEQRDYLGRRPIHIASMLNECDVLSPLIDAGVHLDTVDGTGLSIFQSNLPHAKKILLYSYGPPPLSCCAARAIVAFNLLYDKLPSHMIYFVQTHDNNNLI